VLRPPGSRDTVTRGWARGRGPIPAAYPASHCARSAGSSGNGTGTRHHTVSVPITRARSCAPAARPAAHRSVTPGRAVTAPRRPRGSGPRPGWSQSGPEWSQSGPGCCRSGPGCCRSGPEWSRSRSEPGQCCLGRCQWLPAQPVTAGRPLLPAPGCGARRAGPLPARTAPAAPRCAAPATVPAGCSSRPSRRLARWLSRRGDARSCTRR